MSDSTHWGADTIISMPAPLRKDQAPLVDMGGFVFTEGGLAHNLNRADLETYLTPTFQPSPIIPGD